MRAFSFRFPASTRRWALIVSLAVVPNPLSWAGALQFEGQYFEDRVVLAGQPLRLNGLGVRAVSVIRGYAAALYLPQPATSHAEASGQSGPKRLEIRLLRNVPAHELAQALTRGVSRNSTQAVRDRLADRLQQLTDRFEQAGPRRKSDTVSLDYLPGQGTELRINGALQGPPIPGEDLYAALLSVFIGAHPADERLRRGLLGLPSAPS